MNRPPTHGRRIGCGFYFGPTREPWQRFHVATHGRDSRGLVFFVPASFQSWRFTASSTPDFFGLWDGLQSSCKQASALEDPEVLLRLFSLHGPSWPEAEHHHRVSALNRPLPALAATPPRGAELWLYLQENLARAHTPPKRYTGNCHSLATCSLYCCPNCG